MDVQIDRVAGIYRWADGIASPSVTTILRGILPEIGQWSNDDALLRGRIVHRAVALLEGDVDGSGLAWDTLDPAFHGYVKAWQAWKAAHEWVTIHAELRLRSTKYGFSGTPDLIGTMRQRKARVRALCDLKTGPMSPWWALQTSAYCAAYTEATGEKIAHRFSLILNTDGTYDAGHVWTSALDWPTFLAFLSAYRWKEHNGYGNRNGR